MRISYIQSDICQVPASTLITLINSNGHWNGGVDNAIYQSSGLMFHSQVADLTRGAKMADNTSIFVRQTGFHKGEMGSVLFVVDDLKNKLSALVKTGLDEADRQFMSTVIIPVFRTGKMLGIIEESVEDVIQEIIKGIEIHLRGIGGLSRINNVTIVVAPDNDEIFDKVKFALKRLTYIS